MNGLVNSDPDVIHHLDREMVKDSDVIPVVFGKDGGVQESRSSVAKAVQFETLRAFVGRKLKASGNRSLTAIRRFVLISKEAVLPVITVRIMQSAALIPRQQAMASGSFVP